MTPLHLGVAQEKGRSDGTEKSHKLKGALDRDPNKTEKYIGACQKYHSYQGDTTDQKKDLIQNLAYLLQIADQCTLRLAGRGADQTPLPDTAGLVSVLFAIFFNQLLDVLHDLLCRKAFC